MKNFLMLVILLSSVFQRSMGQSQKLTDESMVSMITCTPQKELYALFGHSAIRVVDPAAKIDLVFNYGTFDFNTPNFYMKFAQGRLNYQLGVSPYAEFIYVYRDIENRSIYEQTLNLTLPERQKLLDFLVDTYQDPEKRNYQYDFFYDNCATRVWEAVAGVMGDKLQFGKHRDAGELSHREVIDGYLEPNPWADWGIDLILGSVIDEPATNKELMFLPDYMLEIFEISRIHREDGTVVDLVGDYRVIHESGGRPKNTLPFLASPDFIFWTFFAIMVVLGYSRFNKLNNVLDIVYFEIIGLLGVIIVFMWFFTDHDATKANFNILWACPIHLFTPLLLLFSNRKARTEKVFMAFGIFYFAIFLFWIAIPQELNPGFRPLILLLAFRYFFHFRRLKVARLRS